MWPSAGQAHRDRVDEDDFVAGARELAHQMGLGVRMVIPPVFAAKADYRSITQHRIPKILQDPSTDYADGL